MAGLSSFAVLLTATRALRGKTDCGQGIVLAPRESLTIKSPQIAVFTSNGTSLVKGRDLADAEGFSCIRFELYCPAEAKITDGTTTLDTTSSASGELVLSAMWNDCVRTLLVDSDPWPELFRNFCLRFKKYDFTTNIFETKEGGRIGMRAVDLQVETLSEPIVGRPATGAWNQLLTKMAADGDPESLILATYLRDKIEKNISGVWQVQAASTGIGVAHLGEIGSGSLQWLDIPKDER